MKCKYCGWTLTEDHVCTSTGSGEVKPCPCDEQSKEECRECADKDFIKIIQEQQERITKLEYDNNIMFQKLRVIKTMAEA